MSILFYRARKLQEQADAKKIFFRLNFLSPGYDRLDFFQQKYFKTVNEKTLDNPHHKNDFRLNSELKPECNNSEEPSRTFVEISSLK